MQQCPNTPAHPVHEQRTWLSIVLSGCVCAARCARMRTVAGVNTAPLLPLLCARSYSHMWLAGSS
jgi:hypothetical protein